MATPLRNTDPSVIHLVTLRTERAELNMIPSRDLNELIGGIIARYQEKHAVLIFGLIFLANHYHLLCSAPRGNLWKFEQDINREIARRTNWKLGREGRFWSRRYSDQAVLEENDQIEALLYILTNPTHHGLVANPASWPGLTAIHQLKTGKAEKYTFTHYSDYNAAKERGERVRLDEFKTEHLLRLSPLPALKAKTLTEQWEQLAPLLRERAEKLVRERRQEGKGFMGAAKVRKQVPGRRPRVVKRSPRPPCYTKSPLAKRLYLNFYYALLDAYKKASYLFRLGDLSTEFPPHTLKPPLHCVPT